VLFVPALFIVLQSLEEHQKPVKRPAAMDGAVR